MKPVALDESKIPWNIKVGEQVICPATKLMRTLLVFFPGT